MKKIEKKELAIQIIENIGGKDNISNLIHCMTRLRFSLKDKSLVNIDAISKLKGVIGVQWSNDQFQIIIGQWVSELYRIICETTDINVEDKDNKKSKFKFSSIIDAISGCLAPAIPIVVGAGMLKVVLIIASILGILSESSSTYYVLSFVSDAGFYFLPIYLGAFSANKFKTSMPLGMFMGAIFLHPSFVNSIVEGKSLSIFNISIYSTNYANSIFPIIITVFVMSYVERFFSKYVPNAVKVIFVPLFTIIVMLPLALCIIGPAGSYLGIYIADAIMFLYNTTGFLGIAVLSALYPLLVITGMHGALFPPMMQSLTTLGYEPIIGLSGVISNLNQGAATLGVALKNKEERSTAISSSVTAIFGGVTEPAMFGINLKYKMPLYATMIGSFIGGAIAGILKVYMFALGGSAGIFGITGFINKLTNNIIFLLIAILAGFISTFIITLLIYKVDKE